MTIIDSKEKMTMDVPSYQIHNVMKVYSRQISQGKFIGRGRDSSASSSMDKITLSSEGRRQEIIDRVASGIVDRIARQGPTNPEEKAIVDRLEEEIGQQLSFGTESTGEFVFNIIDRENNKTKGKLSIEDTGFVLKKLEELTRKAVDKNMASPV